MIATFALGFCFITTASNPDAENLIGNNSKIKSPGNSLIVRIDPKTGKKTVFSVKGNKLLTEKDFQAAAKKFGGDGSAKASKAFAVNPDAEKLDVAPSWYYVGGYYGHHRHNYGYYNNYPYMNYYHYGYNPYSSYGYYPYQRYYNSYRYDYGWYYSRYYTPYYWGGYNWYYYYPPCY